MSSCPDARLFEVRGALIFKRSSLLVFQAYARAYIAFFFAQQTPNLCTYQVLIVPWGTKASSSAALCVLFTFNRYFQQSASSAASVRADAPYDIRVL